MPNRAHDRVLKGLNDSYLYGYADSPSPAVEFIEKGTGTHIHSPLWKLHTILLNGGVNKIADDWLKIYNK